MTKERAEEIKNVVCDDLCFYAQLAGNTVSIEEQCDNCPFIIELNKEVTGNA